MAVSIVEMQDGASRTPRLTRALRRERARHLRSVPEQPATTRPVTADSARGTTPASVAYTARTDNRSSRRAPRVSFDERQPVGSQAATIAVSTRPQTATTVLPIEDEDALAGRDPFTHLTAIPLDLLERGNPHPRPSADRISHARYDTGRSNTGQLDTAQFDATRVDVRRPDTARPDSQRQGIARTSNRRQVEWVTPAPARRPLRKQTPYSRSSVGVPAVGARSCAIPGPSIEGTTGWHLTPRGQVVVMALMGAVLAAAALCVGMTFVEIWTSPVLVP